METMQFQRVGVFAAIAVVMGLSAATARADNVPPPLILDISFNWVADPLPPATITQFDPVTVFYKVNNTAISTNLPLIVDGSTNSGIGTTDNVNSSDSYTTFGLFGVYTLEYLAPTITGNLAPAPVFQQGIAVAFVLQPDNAPLNISFDATFADFLATHLSEDEASITAALINANNGNTDQLAIDFSQYIINRTDTNGLINTDSTIGNTMTIIAFSDGVAIGDASFFISAPGGDIPEPASLGLLVLGSLALLARRKSSRA